MSDEKKVNMDGEGFPAATAVLVEPETETKQAPVDSPDYALYYYKGEKKNFNAASLWVAFAYTLIGWGLMYFIYRAVILADEYKFDLTKIPTLVFGAVTLLGVVAVLLAIVGFITSAARKQSVIPGVVALVLTIGTAIGTWFLFV